MMIKLDWANLEADEWFNNDRFSKLAPFSSWLLKWRLHNSVSVSVSASLLSSPPLWLLIYENNGDSFCAQIDSTFAWPAMRCWVSKVKSTSRSCLHFCSNATQISRFRFLQCCYSRSNGNNLIWNRHSVWNLVRARKCFSCCLTRVTFCSSKTMIDGKTFIHPYAG